MTTNLPFDSWTEVLGPERLAGATLDRLTHRCRIIETKGESCRLTDAKTRARRTKPIRPVDEAQGQSRWDEAKGNSACGRGSGRQVAS